MVASRPSEELMDYSAPPMSGHPFFPLANNFPLDDCQEIHTAYMENIDPLLRQDSLQRYLQEADMAFLTNTFVPPFPSQQVPPVLTRGCEIVPSFPILPSQHFSKERMNSPALSHSLSDSCSSARSPADELDNYQDMWQHQQIPNTYSPIATSSTMTASFSPISFSNSCVALSEVQEIPGVQELVYPGEYTDEPKEDTIEGDHHEPEFGYNFGKFSPSDSALGSSICDASSPHSLGYTQVEAEADFQPENSEDLELDAECEDESIVVETRVEEDSVHAWAEEDADDDTDYSPKPSRGSKRKASTLASPAAKRGRVMTKKSSKANLECKSCQETFANVPALQRHIVSEHTRAFVCVFSFAGCTATFASKNEWKRHVSSQHLNLVYWLCTQGACGRANSSKSQGVFNRKDLFTQHMRRMHAPPQVKKQQKKDAHWDTKLKNFQETCKRTRGSPPARLGCPVQGCKLEFAGTGCWDDRMEHIGKHLEKVVAGRAEEDAVIIRNEDDKLLVDWALSQNIIEHKGNGYALCSKDKMDADAEGEEC
ncbi:hypothetical protein F5884DRAFT_61724 [Xylogone sp. PMI_703]|nr:hypothetical protein F5884DRAFT_61724 [Xylogone sp. PMI_703]